MLARLVLVLAAALSFVSAPLEAAAAERVRVLLFSHSTGYRHDSIEPGVSAIKALGAREGLEVTATEDPDVFTAERLKAFDVVLLLSTSTDPKKPESEWFRGARGEAFQAFVRRGGGVVGVHAASDSHYHWPWYGRLIGGRFASHPPGTPEGALQVRDADHPSTRGLPQTFRRTDEWYVFGDYDPTSRLLVTLDPQSIGSADVNPDPISWAHEFEGGRVFYTAMGHTKETYADPLFLQHLAGGVRWAARR